MKAGTESRDGTRAGAMRPPPFEDGDGVERPGDRNRFATSKPAGAEEPPHAETSEAGPPAADGPVAEPPRSLKGHLHWLGPAFLWMASAAGSGELLFTPRVAAQYGYTLLWALLAAVVLKWFINREIGRFAVCTGQPILQGFTRLPGRWAGAALWLIVVPQLVAAVALTAGIAGAAATAADLLLPGGARFWTPALIVAASSLALWGRYGAVEKVATFIVFTLAAVAVVAAVMVGPDPAEMASGLVPGLPPNLDLGEVLPWIGFALSGAAGLMYYSYWTTAKGYGAATPESERENEQESERGGIDPKELPEGQRERLRGWLKQLTLDNSVAVVGVLIPTISFLILGAELLRPEGLVPGEGRIAQVLGRLLGGVFGQWGYWAMIAGVLVGFSGTLLGQQDGYSRMFADGTRALAGRYGLGGRWRDRGFLKKAYIVVLLTALPIGAYLAFGKPVGLLQLAGAIEAAQIPVIAALALFLNRRVLPEGLRPGRWSVAGGVLAALFFFAFAVAYVLSLLGVF